MLSRTLGGGTLEAFGRSDPGLQRENNEDRHYVDAERGLFMVIDGVGGHAAGEKAADTALQMLLARLERETGTPAERLREAITLANNEIHRLAASNPDWRGMACVLTAAHVADGVVTVGHVGDTRLYKFRDGSVRKLTHDHSPVGEREDRGELSEQDAMRHPRRNEIYRDVGSEEHSPTDAEFIEIVEAPFEPDAALLLCTDGLTDLVPAAALRQIVYEHAGSRAFVVHRLIEAANEAGGKDNVTAVYVEGEDFAAAARSFWRAAGGTPERDRGWRRWWRLAAGAAARPFGGRRGGRRNVRAWAAALALLLAGCLAGLALAFVAVSAGRSLPPWLSRFGVKLSWSRTWTGGADARADFETIGEALAAARPGDTIDLAPGDYREAIRLPAGVSLVGHRSHPAVIRPSLDELPGWTAVEADGAAGGRIANLRIAGDDGGRLAVGVLLHRSSVELENIEITGAERAGVEAEGPGNAVLRASFIHHNPGAGVSVRRGATLRLLHNVITNNGTQAAGGRPGVEVEEGARPVFFGNIIAANGVEGIVGLPSADRDAVGRENTIGPAVPAPRHDAAPKRDPARRPDGRGRQ